MIVATGAPREGRIVCPPRTVGDGSRNPKLRALRCQQRGVPGTVPVRHERRTPHAFHTAGPPLQVASQLAASVDALAALAAHLRVESEGLAVDPAVRASLAAVARSLLGDTASMPEATRRSLVGLARTFLLQATELIEHPDRPPGWSDPDPTLLQSIGQLSMGIAGAIDVAARARPSLAARLAADTTTVVDVGTGSGWLAIALARANPAVRVVGVDVFEPALQLARANVLAAGLGGRVELRHQDAATLAPDSADVVWVPMPFIPREAVGPVLAAAVRALRPGGWLLPGTFPCPGESLAERLMTLRTIRSGGHPWDAAELTQLMREAGVAEAAEVPCAWPAPVRLYAGQKP